MKVFSTTQKRDIGARVKELRKKQSITQEQLARSLDMSVSHISKIEVGVGNTSESLLHRLADLFVVDKSWLETGNDSPSPPPPAPAGIAEEPAPYGVGPSSRDIVSRAIALTCDERIQTAANGVASALGCGYVEALILTIQRELGKQP